MKDTISMGGCLLLALLCLGGAWLAEKASDWLRFGFFLLLCNFCFLGFCFTLIIRKLERKIGELEKHILSITEKGGEHK